MHCCQPPSSTAPLGWGPRVRGLRGQLTPPALVCFLHTPTTSAPGLPGIAKPINPSVPRKTPPVGSVLGAWAQAPAAPAAAPRGLGECGRSRRTAKGSGGVLRWRPRARGAPRSTPPPVPSLPAPGRAVQELPSSRPRSSAPLPGRCFASPEESAAIGRVGASCRAGRRWGSSEGEGEGGGCSAGLANCALPSLPKVWRGRVGGRGGGASSATNSRGSQAGATSFAQKSRGFLSRRASVRLAHRLSASPPSPGFHFLFLNQTSPFPRRLRIPGCCSPARPGLSPSELPIPLAARKDARPVSGEEKKNLSKGFCRPTVTLSGSPTPPAGPSPDGGKFFPR